MLTLLSSSQCNPWECRDNALSVQYIACNSTTTNQFMTSSTSLPQQLSDSERTQFQPQLHNPTQPVLHRQAHPSHLILIPKIPYIPMPTTSDWSQPSLRSQAFPSFDLQNNVLGPYALTAFAHNQQYDQPHYGSYDDLFAQISDTPSVGITSPYLQGVASSAGPKFTNQPEDWHTNSNEDKPFDHFWNQDRGLNKSITKKDTIPKQKGMQSLTAAANKLGLKWLRVRMHRVFCVSLLRLGEVRRSVRVQLACVLVAV
jgi:hypothetical protein